MMNRFIGNRRRSYTKSSIFRITGLILAFTGFLILILFLVSLWNNGYRISLKDELDLNTTSLIGNFLAGTLGPIWALASVAFFLEALTLQQNEIIEIKKTSNDETISNLLLRIIDTINTEKFYNDRVYDILILEFRKFFIAYSINNSDDIKQTMELMIKTLPLDKKYTFFNQSLLLDKIGKAKLLYDTCEEFNKKNKHELLRFLPSQLLLLENIMRLVNNISQEKQIYYFILLKSKLGLLGNIFMLLMIFYNQFSWNTFKYYTYSELADMFIREDCQNIRFENEYNEYEITIIRKFKENLSTSK
jgi:hypothetical protein